MQGAREAPVTLAALATLESQVSVICQALQFDNCLFEANCARIVAHSTCKLSCHAGNTGASGNTGGTGSTGETGEPHA